MGTGDLFFIGELVENRNKLPVPLFYRVSYAKRLLKQGVPLKEVAIETGFSDQSHFANRFKRVVGVTPGFYIKEHFR